MNFIDFLVFIVTMLLFVYLSVRKVWIDKKRLQNQEPFDEQESDELEGESHEEIMRAMNLSKNDIREYERVLGGEKEGVASRHTPPPAPPVKQNDPQSKKKIKHSSQADGFRFKGGMENYEATSSSQAKKFVSDLDDRYKNIYEPKRQSVIGEVEIEDPYAIRQYNKISKGKILLKKLASKKDAVILHEILGPPRAFKEHDVSSR